MATGRLQWGAHEGAPGDGSTGNAGPALVTLPGTEANPKKPVEVAQFDAATAEHLWFGAVMPAEYLSGGTVDLYWMANAVTVTAVRWAARIGAVTPGDVDTPIEHVTAALSAVATNVNTVEARRLTKTSIVLANLDTIAGGDVFWLLVYRDAADAADTLAIDAELLRVELNFTV